MSASRTSGDESGRAKRACLSCRQRRRWCDKALPSCLICTTAGRQCEYATEVVRGFINLDANNVSQPNNRELLRQALTRSTGSSLTGNAPSSSDTSLTRTFAASSTGILPLGRLNADSLRTDFRQHVEAIWGTFVHDYCQTKDYWPPGCSLLALQNQVLDLSLIALSSQRLALKSPKSDLPIISLTAYNNSLSLYRQMIQNRQNVGLTAILAVTSTVYALIEVFLMQPEDIATVGWGDSGHFDGALALMQQTGPHIYSSGGFHLVFKKIREMGFFLAVSRQQKTFLLTEDWMTIPWITQPKTWRDRLYDLALAFSEIMVSFEGNDKAATPPEAIASQIQKSLEIEGYISTWKSAWLSEQYPHLQVRCSCHHPEPFSCICSIPVLTFPSTDFALLQLECWALQLLISFRLSRALENETGSTMPWAAYLPARSSQIASCIEASSVFPAFQHAEDRSSALTEGLCRMLFSSWTLREYKGIGNHTS